MRSAFSPLFGFIDRHKAAFACSLTFVLIGFFAGLSYAGQRDMSSEMSVQRVGQVSFWAGFFVEFTLQAVLLLVLLLTGKHPVTAYLVAPILLLWPSFRCGASLIAQGGIWAAAGGLIARLPYCLIILALYALGGTAAFGLHAHGAQARAYASYHKLFFLLAITLLLACLLRAALLMLVG